MRSLIFQPIRARFGGRIGRASVAGQREKSSKVVKPESRKNVEKIVKNVKNDEKMSKKRLISVLNEGKNSVKSNKIFKLLI